MADRTFSIDEARAIGNELGIDRCQVDIRQLPWSAFQRNALARFGILEPYVYPGRPGAPGWFPRFHPTFPW